jgi:hypothetical protein
MECQTILVTTRATCTLRDLERKEQLGFMIISRRRDCIVFVLVFTASSSKSRYVSAKFSWFGFESVVSEVRACHMTKLRAWY